MEKIQIIKTEQNHLQAIHQIKTYYIEKTATTLALLSPPLKELIQWYQGRSGPYIPFSALYNGEVVGYAYLSPFRLDISPAYSISAENSVYVHPDYKGKGIGKLLMQKLLEIARHYQIQTIVSCITANNSNSIEFHRSLGFHYDGRLHNVAEKNNTLLDIAFMTLSVGLWEGPAFQEKF